MKSTLARAFATALAIFFAFANPSPTQASPRVSGSFDLAALAAISALPKLVPGFQPGFSISSSGILDVPFRSSRETEGESFSVSLGIHLDAFWFGQSAPTQDGNLYRAWRGFGSGILGGIKTDSFPLPFGMGLAHMRFLAGAGLRAFKYTGTGIVSAYLGYLGKATLEWETRIGPDFILSIPVEYAPHSGGWSIFSGISLGVRYP